MRNLIVLLLLISCHLQAQLIDDQVKEETILIDGIATTVQKASVVGNVDDFRDQWRSFLKNEFNVRSSRKGDVLTAEEVVINRITDRRGDLIIFLYPLEKEVSFNVAYKLGYDIYLNSEEFPEETAQLKEFTAYFINYYYYHYLEDYISRQEKNLRDLRKDLKKATKTIQKADRSVAKLQRKISKNEKRIERLSSSVSTASESEKEAIRTEINQAQAENIALRQEAKEAQKPVSRSEDMIQLLEPKIAELEEKLDHNRLMFVEARDRIKR